MSCLATLRLSPEDRAENIPCVGEAAALFADSGIICITAFISPYRVDRDRARASAPGRFHEIYIEADVATCEQRDPKGLYKRARAGHIPQRSDERRGGQRWGNTVRHWVLASH